MSYAIIGVGRYRVFLASNDQDAAAAIGGLREISVSSEARSKEDGEML